METITDYRTGTAMHPRDFDWHAHNMVLRAFACKDHPACTYSTKHYHDRNWHYTGTVTECDCSCDSFVMLAG